MKIWVTADEWKIPVRVESEVIIGNFVGDLVSAENVGRAGAVYCTR